MSFNFPVNIFFNCSMCGLCCGDTESKTRHILLLKKDAERIAAQTKMRIRDFASEITDKAPFAFEMNKSSENGKCFFLQHNKCSIYKQRPLICRFYPFELSPDESGVPTFTATLECPEISQKGADEKKLGKKHFRKLLKLVQR